MSYPVSQDFRTALATSHHAAFYATIEDGYGSTLVEDLPVTTGTVTVDRTASVRRTVTATLAIDPDIAAILPDGINRSPLDPYANYLRLYRGIEFVTGVRELCPLGLFRITQSEPVEGGGDRHVTLTGSDRSAQVSDAKYAISAYTIARGTNVYTAIGNLIADRLPTAVQIVSGTTAYTTPMLVIDGTTDPWTVAQDLAASAGAEVFFDVDGNLAIQPEPDPTTDPPDWLYEEGPDCTMTTLDRIYDLASTYNAVIVTGENSQGDAPVVGVAYDLDPESPTYWFGTFGQRPTSISSPLALTNAQATTIAATTLRSMTGLTEQTKLSIVPNPALDVEDTIHVARAVMRFDATLLVDSYTLPLDLNSTQDLVCRTRRVSP